MIDQDRDTAPFEVEEQDTTSPDAAAVAAFLKGADTADEPEDVEEEKKEEPDKDNFNITLNSDDVFEENKREVVENMFISVKDADITVTDDDKSLYLKATMGGVPVILDIDMPNGFKIQCRSLSMYEGDLVYDALTEYLAVYPDISSALWEAIIQQFRATMQVTRFNGRACDYQSFTFEPSKRKEHAKQLLDYSNKSLMDMPSPVFGIYVRGLNVFQHKLNRLQEAAFNGDFWLPGATD